MSDADKAKHVRFCRILHSGTYARTYINPKLSRPSGHLALDLPRRLMLQDQVILEWGLDMPTPIQDLYVDHRKVQGTLIFSGSTVFCAVPWWSVFALSNTDGMGKIWPEIAPVSFVKERVKQETSTAAPVLQRGHLRLIKGGKS